MRLLIEHRTCYRYRQPVAFDPHRLMLMPHEGHALSIRDFHLRCRPEAEIAWLHDVFGNSVAVATFARPARTLSITSRVEIERHGPGDPAIPLADRTITLPASYAASERPDLDPWLTLRHPADASAIDAWLEPVRSEAGDCALAFLAALNRAIRSGLDYRVRLQPGIQSPAETLRKGAGTCRDFALLMIEAARRQGLAARFVSGYLYDAAHDPELHGAGHTHAWAQIYLPGPGWVEYDPTNAKVASPDLIRAAVARDPDQAIPVQGTYRGPPGASRSMDVAVEVTRIDAAAPPAEEN